MTEPARMLEIKNLHARLTDGREIYARTASGAFFNLLRAPAQALMVVGNEGLLKDLSGKVRTRASRRKKISG